MAVQIWNRRPCFYTSFGRRCVHTGGSIVCSLFWYENCRFAHQPFFGKAYLLVLWFGCCPDYNMLADWFDWIPGLRQILRAHIWINLHNLIVIVLNYENLLMAWHNIVFRSEPVHSCDSSGCLSVLWPVVDRRSIDIHIYQLAWIMEEQDDAAETEVFDSQSIWRDAMSVFCAAVVACHTTGAQVLHKLYLRMMKQELHLQFLICIYYITLQNRVFALPCLVRI